MQDIVFGKKKDVDVIVKPKTKFIPCVKNDKNKISIKKEDAVLIGKIDVKDIPIIKETEEIMCFLENSNGFYDGKVFSNIENAIDITNIGIEFTENMKNDNYSKVYYKVKTINEFIKI